MIAVACQATGMGWIKSAVDPTQKATFGFVFASDGITQSFSGSYHDHAAGVDLKGTGVLKPKPAPPGVNSKGGCLFGVANYVSQNQAFPGEGLLELTVCDLDGGGPGPGDFILITVLTGPFAAYTNSGFPSGNITVTCSGDCVTFP
jgi:hypothetical protein